MNKFISIISNGDFWIAIVVAFIVSFVLAYIAQDIFNSLILNRDIHEYLIIDEELTIGCTVYDTLTKRVGTYCGIHQENDTLYGVVVTKQNNTVYYSYSVLENLLTIKEQE